MSCACGCLDVVCILLKDERVDPTKESKYGVRNTFRMYWWKVMKKQRSPLCAASEQLHTSIVKLLLEDDRVLDTLSQEHSVSAKNVF